VSGAYEHTLNMQPRASTSVLRAARARAAIAIGSRKRSPRLQVAKDLKGLKVGVWRRSSTHMIVNYFISRDVSSLRHLGGRRRAERDAITALKSGQDRRVSKTDR